MDCFLQCEVVGSQIALDGVQPRDMEGHPRGLFQLSGGGAVRIILSSASSSTCAIYPNMERRHDWIYRCEVRLNGPTQVHTSNQLTCGSSVFVEVTVTNNTQTDHTTSMLATGHTKHCLHCWQCGLKNKLSHNNICINIVPTTSSASSTM